MKLAALALGLAASRHAAPDTIVALAIVASIIGGLVVVSRRYVRRVKPTVRTPACGSLRCVQGELVGRRFDIPASGLVVGRDRSAGIAIRDGRVSGDHAHFVVAPGRIAIVDKSSTNGTYVNGLRMTTGSTIDLRDGDFVSVVEPAVATFVYQRAVAA